MPDYQSHVNAAESNQRAVEYLKQRIDDFPEWVVTVAFYKAVHVVEALFCEDPNLSYCHTSDHRERNDTLRKTRRYQNIWKNYKQLYNASRIARYLTDCNAEGQTYSNFSSYMDKKTIESLVLRHYLTQVEKSAAKLLNKESL